jgi:hypothetical protein
VIRGKEEDHDKRPDANMKTNRSKMPWQRRGMMPSSSSVPIIVYVLPDPAHNHEGRRGQERRLTSLSICKYACIVSVKGGLQDIRADEGEHSLLGGKVGVVASHTPETAVEIEDLMKLKYNEHTTETHTLLSDGSLGLVRAVCVSTICATMGVPSCSSA